MEYPNKALPFVHVVLTMFYLLSALLILIRAVWRAVNVLLISDTECNCRSLIFMKDDDCGASTNKTIIPIKYSISTDWNESLNFLLLRFAKIFWSVKILRVTNFTCLASLNDFSNKRFRSPWHAYYKCVIKWPSIENVALILLTTGYFSDPPRGGIPPSYSNSCYKDANLTKA